MYRILFVRVKIEDPQVYLFKKEYSDKIKELL